MLQKNEMLKLQNLLAIYQLQMANEIVLEFHTEWKQNPDTGECHFLTICHSCLFCMP